MEDNNDILELKEQLAALQARLDREVELKDETIRKALDHSIARFRSLGNKGFYMCLFSTVIVLIILYVQKVSVPLFICTLVFMALNLYISYILKEKYTVIDSSDSLVTTSRKVLDFKKYNRKSTLYMSPLVLIWAVWYAYELGSMNGLETFGDFLPLLISLTVGGLIGGCIVFFGFYKPSMKEADRIAEQIKDLNQ